MTKVADSPEMGTDRPALDEIEVTPEMIEAGASILYGMKPNFAREEFWAREIFEAMWRAR